MPDEFKSQDVREAVLDVMLDIGDGENYRVARGVAEKLKTDVLSAGGFRRHLADKLGGQITRALNSLASESILVKLAKGSRDLYGNYVNNAVYYTPKAFAQAEDTARKYLAEETARRQRWEVISDKLTSESIPMDQRPGEPVVLGLDAWEKLLGIGWPQS